jgi:hypothetical protein
MGRCEFPCPHLVVGEPVTDFPVRLLPTLPDTAGFRKAGAIHPDPGRGDEIHPDGQAISGQTTGPPGCVWLHAAWVLGPATGRRALA